MMRVTVGVFLLAGVVGGCSGSSNNNTPGTGGASAGTTGTAGTAAGGTSGAGTGGASAGGTPGFMAVAPCADESAYVSGTTVNFGGALSANYDPKCLKVPAGTTVTFSGDFSMHPLTPSAMRGNTTDNPIVNMSAGTTATVTFPNAGFYAYLCNFHGSDNGTFMTGVVWVQ
jgi:plastocyanin